MKRLLLSSGALALCALLLAGCASVRRPVSPQPRAFALAVTVHGTLQPTPAQWTAIRSAAARQLAALGWVLVSDLALADQIIRVDFTPDPADPEHRGHVAVLEFRDNPLRAPQIVQPAVVRSYTYASSYVPSPVRYTGFYDPYPLSYYSSYSDGYTYDAPSGTVAPVPPSRVMPAPVPPAHAGRTNSGYSDTRRTGISRHGGSESRGRGSDSGSNPPPSQGRSESGYSGGSSSGSSYTSSSSSSASYDSSSYSSSSGGSSYSSSSGGDSSSRSSMERVER